jgi:CHAT domain-containing protein
VILPGFSTAAETGGRGGDGLEISNAILAFMAAGSRTVLLARWQTGGQTSFDLLREFLQEVDQSTPSEAWQRSVNVVRRQQVCAQWEPRVSLPKETDVIGTGHPFFWAAFLLADQGSPAAKPVPEAESPREAALADQAPAPVPPNEG